MKSQNISTLSLGALRDKIASGTREVPVRSDDGSISIMVYIPKFTVPAGLWENGQFPTRPLNLGGFLIDKYQCSHVKATHRNRGIGANVVIAEDSQDIAISTQGKVLWNEISFDNAKIACANRKVNGVSAHLVTMKEWATVCFLVKILGHEIKGNNNYGKDYRDNDVYEEYGIEDSSLVSASGAGPMATTLTGTGPISWSHNGQANGIFDLVGNIWEWVDFTTTDGVYIHVKKAKIYDSDGISMVDNTVTINNVEEPDRWPSHGLIRILAEGTNTEEEIEYTSLLKNQDGSITLAGLVRGLNGTSSSQHGNGANVEQLSKYCVIPEGCVAYIDQTEGIDNITELISFNELIHHPQGQGFVADQMIQCGEEKMIITEVLEGALRVTRGVNGTLATNHAHKAPIIMVPGTTADDYQTGIMQAMRTEDDLLELAIPSIINNSFSGDWRDTFWAIWLGRRVAGRGGYWTHGSRATKGFTLSITRESTEPSQYYGFRAALSLR